ncbi:hypothetical protein E1A91_D12G291600v1 [Gossypium mustelinum]|uniref:Uncharacterized protein n=1 Tax=Gossypium mustelinum TaxID=34275 RepID=A0A5D2SMC2_GOSMU|nr:hypothetical protein E1A91_D12G291600v1 [Gossypium mustelinum]
MRSLRNFPSLALNFINPFPSCFYVLVLVLSTMEKLVLIDSMKVDLKGYFFSGL